MSSKQFLDILPSFETQNICLLHSQLWMLPRSFVQFQVFLLLWELIWLVLIFSEGIKPIHKIDHIHIWGWAMRRPLTSYILLLRESRDMWESCSGLWNHRGPKPKEVEFATFTDVDPREFSVLIVMYCRDYSLSSIHMTTRCHYLGFSKLFFFTCD